MTIASFAVVQWLRTPASVQEWDAGLREFSRLFQQEGRFSVEDADWWERRVKTQSSPEDALETARLMIHTLWDLDQCLIINDGPCGLITSDIGLVMHNQFLQCVAGVGTSGFGSRGLQVLIPLSPRHLLVLYDSDVYRRHTVVRTNAVRTVNELVFRGAEENVYYDGHPATSLAIDELARSTVRARRDEQVRGKVVPVAGGKILHVHGEPGRPICLPWFKLTLKARRMPLQDRLKLRPAFHPDPAYENLQLQARGVKFAEPPARDPRWTVW